MTIPLNVIEDQRYRYHILHNFLWAHPKNMSLLNHISMEIMDHQQVDEWDTMAYIASPEKRLDVFFSGNSLDQIIFRLSA